MTIVRISAYGYIFGTLRHRRQGIHHFDYLNMVERIGGTGREAGLMNHPGAHNSCGAITDFDGQIGICGTEVTETVGRPYWPVEAELFDTRNSCDLRFSARRLAADRDTGRQREVCESFAFEIQILVTGSCVTAGIGCHPLPVDIGTHARQSVDCCSAGNLPPGIHIS